MLPSSLSLPTPRVLLLAHVGFFVGVALVAAMGWLLYDATRRTDSASRAVDHTQEVLAVVSQMNSGLARAESAQRGYLLTGRADFIDERDAAFAELRQSAARFDALTRDNGGRRERMVALRAGIDERVNLALATAAARPASSPLRPAAADPLPGREASQRLYALTQAITEGELRLLNERRENERARQGQMRLALAGAGALAVLVLLPAYLGVVRQTRRRERAEAQLLDMAESLPLTVYRFRTCPDGRLQAEFLARSAEELRGMDRAAARSDAAPVIVRAIHPDDRAATLQAARTAVEQAAPFEAEYRVQLRDGRERWIRSTAVLRREPDGSVLWHGYWMDVTDRRRLVDALERARIDADAANRAKSSFLAAMSHEIRTPMNGVLGMLELLALTRLDSEQRQTLGVVRESSISLLRIIDDILDLSKMEAGQLSLHPQPSSVTEVVKRTWRIYGGVASAKGLVLHHAVDPGVSAALWLDPLRLGQVLNNFVSNALKFTAEGSVTVKVEVLAREPGQERLRFTVEDTGIGISEAAQQRLFQPFAQADEGTAHHYGGTGLGLVICKRLAEMMGGEVGMDSAPGRGTRMSLTLWLRVADPKDLPQARLEEAQGDLAATLAARRVAPTPERAAEEGNLVLVVDDHPVNRTLLVHQVNLLGYACVSCDNGFDALTRWERGDIALVMTDCNMPRMSGYDLSRSIRSREGEGHARTPVIACTANALAGEAETCFAAGMDDYLVKPVQLARLMAVLDRWVPLPESRHLPLDEAVPAEAPGAEAPIDLEALAVFGAADAEARRRTLGVFRRVNDADAQQLRRAFDTRDLDAVNALAHRMKGAAKAVGARSLAELAERIERAARRGRWEGLETLADALGVEVARVNEFLDTL